MAMRPTIIAGNWKMHKTISEALTFINELMPLVDSASAEIYLAVPFTCLAAAAEEACEAENIEVGAQNMSDHEDGPWTGEVSGRMIKEAGADFVILGHSERRQHFNEGNGIVNQKLKLAYLSSLQPIVCVGETQKEHESGHAHEVVEKQMRESLAGISREDAASLILAYEPIWAIGTGKNATPEVAQAMHSFCREVLKKVWDAETAQKIPILYGGSAKPDNAVQLLGQADIDGLLVGGASLNAHVFSQIVNANVNNQVA